jgi:glycosyltransferase involved in cell wall biosynthesis
MRRCLNSLVETTKKYPCEILVVDNGENLEDSQWLLQLAHEKKIQKYIRNSENLYFGYARNLAIKVSIGKYLVISDNDILYHDGWLEDCLEFLENHPGKYLATPLLADEMKLNPKYIVGYFDGWMLNLRAGSNCFMLTREHFEDIGWFLNHRIAGTLFNNAFYGKEYLMACMPTPKAEDIGFRMGYNFNDNLDFNKVFTDGSKLKINEDRQ